MARRSTKENKNIYQISREKCEFTRQKASEAMIYISDDRIEKIESGKSLPHPDEIIAMSECYKAPELCNYYCANECPIGQTHVTELKLQDLSQIILEMLASLNRMRSQQDLLIEITSDGVIGKDEIPDFIRIQEDLKRISVTAETLRLWVEQKLASGDIDKDAYREARSGTVPDKNTGK